MSGDSQKPAVPENAGKDTKPGNVKGGHGAAQDAAQHPSKGNAGTPGGEKYNSIHKGKGR